MQDDYSTVCGFRISKWTEFVLEKYVKADKKNKRKFNKNKNNMFQIPCYSLKITIHKVLKIINRHNIHCNLLDVELVNLLFKIFKLFIPLMHLPKTTGISSHTSCQQNV